MNGIHSHAKLDPTGLMMACAEGLTGNFLSITCAAASARTASSYHCQLTGVGDHFLVLMISASSSMYFALCPVIDNMFSSLVSTERRWFSSK